MKRTRSNLVSRNVTCSGRRTSVRLELEIWDALHEICFRERLTIHELCTAVDVKRNGYSLTAALRVFVVTYYRQAATPDGHAKAGHGRLYRRLRGRCDVSPAVEN